MLSLFANLAVPSDANIVPCCMFSHYSLPPCLHVSLVDVTHILLLCFEKGSSMQGKRQKHFRVPYTFNWEIIEQPAQSGFTVDGV